MKELKGQRALATGGTSGIGRATAEALAREGAHVLISGRSEARGAEVVGKLEVSGVPVLAREGLVIKNEHVIAIRAYQDSEIVLVVSAG